MHKRIQKLRQKFLENEIDAIFISQSENRRYLSGFTGSEGYLLISQDILILATDFRYVEQAQKESRNFEVVKIKGELSEWFPNLLSKIKPKKLGFESENTTFAGYQKFTKVMKENSSVSKLCLIPLKGTVESLRAQKDKNELEKINKSVILANSAVKYAISEIKTGMTEREIAWKIEKFLRENGSEPVPFEIIVASGPNSALPHAHPSNRQILTGEPIVMDLGAKVEGYCSDLTRTICLGEQSQTFKEIYDIVLRAQLTAIADARKGMSGKEVDGLARAVIEKAGYKDAFGHGLGHGVGLVVHELPYIGPNSKDILTDGAVFTIEPGIYLSGWGGVRIEDTVTLEKGRVKAFIE
jgi:Xaa-Pro aminopeptidase